VIDEATIRKAVGLLQQAASGSTVIVFGPWARGEANEDSDLDVPVIEPEVASRHEEMVRLHRVLRPLGIPVDVLVYDRKTFDYWADTPGTVLFEAIQKGRIFHTPP
jgi:predicted nucleotidyltransferase